MTLNRNITLGDWRSLVERFAAVCLLMPCLLAGFVNAGAAQGQSANTITIPDLDFYGSGTGSEPSEVPIQVGEIRFGGATAVAAMDDHVTAFKNTPLEVSVLDLLANDRFPSNGAFRIDHLEYRYGRDEVPRGHTDFNWSSFTFSPNRNYVGEGYFSYKLTAQYPNEAAESIAKVRVRIIEPLIAIDDSVQAFTGEPLSISVKSLLGNDLEKTNSGGLAVASVSEPENGQVTFNENSNRIVFTPNADFEGKAYFTYVARNALRHEDTARVTVNVSPRPEQTWPIRLNVAVRLGNIPSHFNQARVRCNLYSTPEPGNPQAQMGTGTGTVSLENGAYDGSVSVEAHRVALLTASPRNPESTFAVAAPVNDYARSYSCSLFLLDREDELVDANPLGANPKVTLISGALQTGDAP